MKSEDKYKIIPEWVKFSESKLTEICNNLGFTSPNDLAVFHSIVDYSIKYETSFLPIDGLVQFIVQYGLKNNISALKVPDTSLEIFKRLYPILIKNKYCEPIVEDNKLKAIVLIDPKSSFDKDIVQLVSKLKILYNEINKNLKLLYPNLEMFNEKNIPIEYMNVIRIDELSKNKIQEIQNKGVITKILLTNNQNILIPTEILNSLFQLSVKKILFFLSSSNEFTQLIASKIRQKFNNIDKIENANDIIKFASNNPQNWVIVANDIINFTQSYDKYLYVVQAAMIVKYMAISASVDLQKVLNENKAMEILLKIMETYNIAYTKSQLLQFRDKHVYLKLYKEQDFIKIVDKFIENYTRIPDSMEPPVIITINQGNLEKYIHRKHLASILFLGLDSMTYEIKKIILDKCDDKNYYYKNDPIFQSPQEYENFIENYFKSKELFLYNLLENTSLLYRLILYSCKNNNLYDEIYSRFFYPLKSDETIPKRKPLSEILNLKQDKIINEIKSLGKYNFNIFIIISDFIKWLFSFGKKVENMIEKNIEIKKEFEENLLELTRKDKKDRKLKDVKDRGIYLKSKEFDRGEIEKKNRKETIKEYKKEDINPKKNTQSDADKKIEKRKKLEEFQKELISNKTPLEMLAYYEKKWNQNIFEQKRKENLNYVIKKIHSRLKFIKDPTPELIQEEAGNLVNTEKNLDIIRNKEALKNYIMIYILNYFLSKH